MKIGSLFSKKWKSMCHVFMYSLFFLTSCNLKFFVFFDNQILLVLLVNLKSQTTAPKRSQSPGLHQNQMEAVLSRATLWSVKRRPPLAGSESPKKPSLRLHTHLLVWLKALSTSSGSMLRTWQDLDQLVNHQTFRRPNCHSVRACFFFCFFLMIFVFG